MSVQLGSLKNRVRAAERRTRAVDEPERQTDENRGHRARNTRGPTSPQSLQPNGSRLDYVTNAPY